MDARASEHRAAPESLASLLGGRVGALDATVPPVAFVGGWLAAGQSVLVGVVAAGAAAVALAGWRLLRGARPRAALVGLLLVALSALITLRTGRAVDFFLVQLAGNAASALAWLVSITVRWPLLGVVVGAVLGQKARWRRDPALLRAYLRGSWVWVAQYLLRVAVLTPLWLADQVLALGAARVALTWPLVAACLAVSWWVVRRALPPDHPGLRHPVPAGPPPAPPGTATRQSAGAAPGPRRGPPARTARSGRQ
ncbi:MAG: DUF3159 domain-containing protein [Micromonosporaceae bacterium]|nr:DUF3159 domain-containing protein [Micromonosporaceae bacterium]